MAIRKFIYDGKEIPDPDPGMSVDEVRQSLAEYFPELYNATTKWTFDALPTGWEESDPFADAQDVTMKMKVTGKPDKTNT
jgi:hypothetical protein